MPLEGFKQAFFDVVVNHLSMVEFSDGSQSPEIERTAIANMKPPALEPRKIVVEEPKKIVVEAPKKTVVEEPNATALITSAKTTIEEEIVELPEVPKQVPQVEKKQAPPVEKKAPIEKKQAPPVQAEKKQAPIETEKKQAPVDIRKNREPVEKAEVTAIPDKKKTADLSNVAAIPKKASNPSETSIGLKKKTWAQSFAADMISKAEATPEVPKPTPVMYSDLPYRDFKDGEHTVSVVGGEAELKTFYVMEYFEGVQKFMEDVEKAIKVAVAKDTSNGYQPKNEEMVMAKFEDVYYRAVVMDNDGKSFKVLFIDYGNAETVKAADIKPFDDSLKMEVVIQEVYFENLPVPLTKKAASLISSENGIKIKVDGFAETGSYKATLIGL